MKEFCIEINESQPLEKVEAKLKEMGYDLTWKIPNAKRSYKFIIASKGGTYSVYTFPHDGEPNLLTLYEL